MLILAVMMAVGCFFLARRFRRDPRRFRKGWRNVSQGLRELQPRPIATIALVVILLLIVARAVRPDVVTLLVVGLAGLALLAFGLAWLREFHYLIHLSDDAFPGRNDKLIWGLLLIVMPPVGVWLFRSHRMAHWPDVKPARPSGWDEFF